MLPGLLELVDEGKLRSYAEEMRRRKVRGGRKVREAVNALGLGA
jgi:hypothetical protein